MQITVHDDAPDLLAREQARLMAAMGKLLVALHAKHGKVQIREAVSRTIDRATQLFDAEERVMRNARYPNMASHCSDHALLLSRLTLLLQSLETENDLESGAGELLGWWSVAHLIGADSYLTDHLKHRCDSGADEPSFWWDESHPILAWQATGTVLRH